MTTYRTGPVAAWVELDGTGKEMIDSSAHDADGNVYLCGHVTQGSRLAGRALAHPGGGVLAGLVASFDREGRPRWHRVVSARSRVSLASVAVDGELVVVSGRFDGGVIELGGGQRLVAAHAVGVVIAFSARDGAIRWGRTIDGESVSLKVNAIAPDGSIVVAGDERTKRLFVASYDRAGNLRWTTTTGQTREGRTHRLAFRGDNVIVVAEMILGDFMDRRGFIAALATATGELRWQRVLEKDTIARDATVRGPLIVVAERKIDDLWNASMMELDPRTGEIRWTRPVGKGVKLEQRAVAMLPDDRIVICGEITPDADIGGRTFADIAGPSDLFVAIVARDGTIDSRSFGGPGSERIRTAHATADGRVAINGHHQGIAVGVVTERGDGFNDGFYAELRLDQLFALPAPSGSR